MKVIPCLLGLTLILAAPARSFPLRPVETTAQFWQRRGIDWQLWGTANRDGDRAALIGAIDRSLRYLDTPKAIEVYRDYPVAGVSLDRVRRSLLRFRQLLRSSASPEELQAAVRREFILYQAVGQDNRGTVAYTGYFAPVYTASRVPTAEYRYPLYRRPANLEEWTSPHPARVELEGVDGLGRNSPLAGTELVWLRNRLEAFLVHVQGSATLNLSDGTTMTVGYAGKTDRPYGSIGQALVADGQLPREGLSLPKIIAYFQRFPQALNRYLPHNESFVFFRETHGAPPIGTLNVPVTPERSIATDKELMPPGALALMRTQIPYYNNAGELDTPIVSRYVLDQDTGSAIRGAGRVDIYMGTGVEAGDRAGIIDWTGELYYLLLKE